MKSASMSKIGILLAAFIPGYVTKAHADQSVAIVCHKVPGTVAGPIVPAPEAAREIYVAVANGRGDKLRPANVRVVEKGDHWTVGQYQGQFVMGGGTLELTISKCDGSILAYYAR
ncbi:MAG TPA: hypothetical protein VE914_10940 [Candidatus Angelobacter sp.]|nr:hypothetical protein [Candidatus Angelobacter sp.]